MAFEVSRDGSAKSVGDIFRFLGLISATKVCRKIRSAPVP